MSVAAVVVSHGHAREVETLVPLLAPQVDDLVVVANTADSAPRTLPSGARLLENALVVGDLLLEPHLLFLETLLEAFERGFGKFSGHSLPHKMAGNPTNDRAFASCLRQLKWSSTPRSCFNKATPTDIPGFDR